MVCGRTANRLFFGSFFSPEKKEHVPPLSVFRNKLVEIRNEFVNVDAVNCAGFFEGLGGGVGSAEAVHAVLHEDGGGHAVDA